MDSESENAVAPSGKEMLAELCIKIRQTSDQQAQDEWPEPQLKACADAGIFNWFIPKEWGGLGWNNKQIVQGYLELSAACLKTTFVITQRTAACRRIIASDNLELKSNLLPLLASGDIFSTVGISHLTTSRRHVGKPVLTATAVEGGYILNGFSPWVTGGAYADWLVLGANITNQVPAEGDIENSTSKQILVAAKRDLAGLKIDPELQLVGLSGSKTGRVTCDEMFVPAEHLLVGPVENALSTSTGGATGGFQTSTLALGLAKAAIEFVGDEARKRENLREQFQTLAEQESQLREQLLAAASGDDTISKEELRSAANSLVLRATQSALVAAKGSGYVLGHPVGRWCQEALFFLVWSCPQSVLDSNLCEFAGRALPS